MADRLVAYPVVRQRNIAVRAAHHFAAGRTLDRRGKPTAIQQHNDLAAFAESLERGLVQGAADRTARVAIPKLAPQVHNRDGRQPAIEHSRG